MEAAKLELQCDIELIKKEIELIKREIKILEKNRESGVLLNFIQAHSRHRIPSMILEYSRLEKGFESHAGKDFL